jgi:hypothetical protein
MSTRSRLAAVVAAVILTGCSTGPFVMRIEPIGGGKIRVYQAKLKVSLFGLSPWTDAWTSEVIDLNAAPEAGK